MYPSTDSLSHGQSSALCSCVVPDEGEVSSPKGLSNDGGFKTVSSHYHRRVYLPLFPLQTAVFPQQAVPLYVFESRYKQLVRYCLDTAEPFGVVRIRRGTEVGMDWTPDQVDRLCTVGTLCRLEQVNEQPDGAFYVVARGLDRFHLCRLVSGDPWPAAQVEVLETAASNNPCPLVRQRLLNAVKPWMRMAEMDEQEIVAVDELAAGELAAFSVSLLPEHAHIHQRALELHNLNEQISALSKYLEHEMRLTTRLRAIHLAKVPRPCGCQLN